MAKSLSCVCLLRQAMMTVTYPTCNLGSAQRGEGFGPNPSPRTPSLSAPQARPPGWPQLN